MRRLTRLEPYSATPAEFGAYHNLVTVIQTEEYPDDPPKSLEFTIKTQQSRADLKEMDCQTWLIQEDARVLARLITAIAHRQTNQHLMDIALHTHPDVRGQGLATLLLHKVLELADANKRSLIVGVTTGRTPAGEQVAERLGASKGIDMHTKQLSLCDLDPRLINAWLSPSAFVQSRYELGCWENEYRERDITAIAQLMEVMNTAPRENLKEEDTRITPAWLCEMVELSKARGSYFWTLYIRHKTRGEFAGYTETFWNPENPKILWQGATGVLPAHRGYGLGKWLKAAMIQKVQQERPSVTCIRTGNADSNAPMLAINQKLGFKPHSKTTIWQLETEQLRSYLQSKTVTVNPPRQATSITLQKG